MAIVYSYPTVIPEIQDLLIGTEMAVQGGEGTPRTKTFTIGSVTQLAVTEAADSAAELYATIASVDLKADLTGATFTGDIIAPAFIKEDGLSTEYLMADGSTFTGGGEYAFPTLQQVTTTGPTTTADITANSFIKTGGTDAQFLKANGSIDSNAYIPYTGATTNVNLGTNTITANSFIKPGGTSVQYLMANGDTSTIPTLQQVTTADATTTNTLTINKANSLQALVITGNVATDGLIQVTASVDGPCIKASSLDGTTIFANNLDGVAIEGYCQNSTGVRGESSEGVGVVGISFSSAGVRGTSTEGFGVVGYGGWAEGGGGIYGYSNDAEAASLVVDGLGRGISVVNGGISIAGAADPTTEYQLLLTANSAGKPSTNTWIITSDSRVKTNINPYTKGLETILAINPITYDYNGKAGFDTATIGNIGIIAQDVLNIIPESINTYQAKLNEEDEENTELYNFDSHALTFILINAVKQLSAEIELLKSI